MFNDLTPNRRHTVTWISDDDVYWYMHHQSQWGNCCYLIWVFIICKCIKAKCYYQILKEYYDRCMLYFHQSGFNRWHGIYIENFEAALPQLFTTYTYFVLFELAHQRDVVISHNMLYKLYGAHEYCQNKHFDSCILHLRMPINGL